MRLLTRLALFLAAILLLASCGLARQDVSLSDEDRAAACAVVRDALTSASGETAHHALPSRLAAPFDGEVFITAYQPSGASIQGGFRGLSLADSLSTASREMRRSKEWKDGRFEGAPLTIQVDVVSARGKIPIPHPKVSSYLLTAGLDGAYMTFRDKAYYLLPSHILHRGIALSQVTTLLGKGRGVPLDLKQRQPPRFYRFRTVSFLQAADGGPAVPLFRGAPLVSNVTARSLLETCVRAGECLLRLQRADGRFHYWYYPATDRYGARDEKEYNLLRHAGTTYCLYQLAGATGRDDFKQAADAALAWLLERVEESDDGALAYPLSGKVVRLGGAGLTLLALLERAKVSSAKDLDARIGQLGAFLVSQQNGDGSFRNAYSPNARRKVAQRPSLYYPGEAGLALARLHAYDGNRRWRDAAARGADFLVHRRGSLFGIELTVAPDSWLMMALAELHRGAPDEKRDAYCFRIGRAMVADQIGEGDAVLDYVGGFLPRPPEVTPAASRLEGLTAAYGLARETGRPTDDWLRAIRLAARFQATCQIGPETAVMWASPARALGVFRGGPEDSSMRIDYAQHNISSLLAATRILREIEDAGPASR